MNNRDELARELFIADNFNQSREASIADWAHFIAEDKFYRGIEHYKTMAAGILAAGYGKLADLTPVGFLDALRADAWDEGYALGVTDEQTSSMNIGIEGLGVKSPANRTNPYRSAS